MNDSDVNINYTYIVMTVCSSFTIVSYLGLPNGRAMDV